MRESMVVTVIGHDRPGLVETLSALVEEHGGNWEESRMVHLAGEFAGLLHVHLPAERTADLERALGDLEEISAVVRSSDRPPEPSDAGYLEIELLGHDHPGIVRRLAATLAARGINIEELETELVSAPMAGNLLFHARSRLRAPEGADLDELEGALQELAGDIAVDIRLEPAADDERDATPTA